MESKETRLAAIIEAMARHSDCLAKPLCTVDEEWHSDVIYHRFLAAVAQAFDVDPYLVALLADYRYIEWPFSNVNKPVSNCAQAVTQNMRQSLDAVAQMLSILVSYCEPCNDTPYRHDAEDRARIAAALRRIASEHGTAEKYARFVSRRLWFILDELLEEYQWYVRIMQDRLDALALGQPFVFSHMANDRPVYAS